MKRPLPSGERARRLLPQPARTGLTSINTPGVAEGAIAPIGERSRTITAISQITADKPRHTATTDHAGAAKAAWLLCLTKPTDRLMSGSVLSPSDLQQRFHPARCDRAAESEIASIRPISKRPRSVSTVRDATMGNDA